MRFDAIKKFTVDELLLDEGNYRFKKAKDQQACIDKIYRSNAQYFKGLMESIAEDDLGEPLLVYSDEKNENIVMDGNRRLSVLKVLGDDKYAPTESIAEYAAGLRDKYKYTEKKIQVQFSTNKKLVAKTVFERHSGGKNGTSRIGWNAYAAARFGFDEQMGSDKDWRIMALLSYTENKKAKYSVFIDSSDFSYEVFRRIIRAALKKNIISQNIFTERGEKIKKTARKDLISDAVIKTTKILDDMKVKKLTLSRKENGIYVDASNIDIYMADFSLSPDNQELEDTKPQDDNDNDNDVIDDSNEDEENGEGGVTSDDESSSGGRNIGIEKSDEVNALLQKLGDAKLKSLYYSLCNISLRIHPVLAYVAAWSFWEVLARKLGSGQSAFPAYFSSRSKSFGFNDDDKKDHNGIMTIISKYGNLSKHSKVVSPTTAANLKSEFKMLEPLLIVALKEAISKNT